MDRDCIRGQMDGSTMVNMSTIKSVAKVRSNGQTGENMTVDGKMEGNMEKELSQRPLA